MQCRTLDSLTLRIRKHIESKKKSLTLDVYHYSLINYHKKKRMKNTNESLYKVRTRDDNETLYTYPYVCPCV